MYYLHADFSSFLPAMTQLALKWEIKWTSCYRYETDSLIWSDVCRCGSSILHYLVLHIQSNRDGEKSTFREDLHRSQPLTRLSTASWWCDSRRVALAPSHVFSRRRDTRMASWKLYAYCNFTQAVYQSRLTFICFVAALLDDTKQSVACNIVGL